MVLLKNRKYRKGFSLLELILVLGVIAGLIVSAFIVYPKVQAAQRVEAEVKNIAAIQAGVQSVYASTNSYSGVVNGSMYKAGVFPDNMVKRFALWFYIVNSWRGNVVLASDDTGPAGTPGSAFTITYNGVPAAECARLISATAANFYIIQVGSITVKNADGNINTGDVSEACSASENNILIFTSL
ncbi:prepilin-type N-terminal cleavage/methylation domain-containing protein [Pectobacterium sp. FL60-S17]|uniref:type 4 pilus major pilin n=1 Tax=Pectobacterium quasiaquaticum TaxID=2774015 RepID=UPI0018772377|nr:type 4 pilus major pilin [Pectobacterium quasiaquaticum]MBE5204363.1 prepilin-type N-terminal cleavage/methylation domain-containing protein [Pectobacterium quasiaquaticum]MBE5210605.1 prepilin-type N-terminal cleavage/methylation domain-containing protein [Pectobacterium quasiaquaticum]